MRIIHKKRAKFTLQMQVLFLWKLAQFYSGFSLQNPASRLIPIRRRSEEGEHAKAEERKTPKQSHLSGGKNALYIEAKGGANETV